MINKQISMTTAAGLGSTIGRGHTNAKQRPAAARRNGAIAVQTQRSKTRASTTIHMGIKIAKSAAITWIREMIKAAR